MRRAGVSVVPLRREPLVSEWFRNATWLRTSNDFLERVLGPDFVVALRSTLQDRLGTLSEGATTAVGWLFDVSGRLLSSAFGVLMTVVFTLIILAYGAPALDRYLNGFFSLFPEEKRERARNVARRIDHDLQAFLRGQLVVVVAIAALSTLAYALAGIPFPLVVGVMGGLLNTIPNIGVFMVGIVALGALVFGTAVGMEPPILFAIYAEGFNGFLLRLALIPIAVEAVQLLDNSFISPRIMSQAINVDPLLITFAVLLGGTLFGFWGVLLAVPCLVVIRATWSAVLAERASSDE
jgi:predicted PurR-regulated permease PerM